MLSHENIELSFCRNMRGVFTLNIQVMGMKTFPEKNVLFFKIA